MKRLLIFLTTLLSCSLFAQDLSDSWIESTSDWVHFVEAESTSAEAIEVQVVQLESMTSADAKARLGFLYSNGIGVPKDDKKAFVLFSEAAGRGDTFGQYCLAVSYAEGLGVKYDARKAMHWLEEAADKGEMFAQRYLADVYFFGSLVDADIQAAHYYVSLAAEQGDPTAQYNLGVCYLEGHAVEADPEVAFQWFLRAAENGDVNAVNQVSDMYRSGLGVEQNIELARQWAYGDETPKYIPTLEAEEDDSDEQLRSPFYSANDKQI